MHRPVSCTNLRETVSFCMSYNTSRSVLNKLSANCRPVSGLDDFHPLNFQMQKVFESWYITINYSR
jgi:hypothetical protein